MSDRNNSIYRSSIYREEESSLPFDIKLTASIVTQNIQLRWSIGGETEDNKILSFSVQRALAEDGPYITIATDIPPTERVYTDINPGQNTYYYRIITNIASTSVAEKAVIVTPTQASTRPVEVASLGNNSAIPTTFVFDLRIPNFVPDKVFLMYENGGTGRGLSIFIGETGNVNLAVGFDNNLDFSTRNNVLTPGKRYNIVVELTSQTEAKIWVNEQGLPISQNPIATTNNLTSVPTTWCGGDLGHFGIFNDAAREGFVQYLSTVRNPDTLSYPASDWFYGAVYVGYIKTDLFP